MLGDGALILGGLAVAGLPALTTGLLARTGWWKIAALLVLLAGLAFLWFRRESGMAQHHENRFADEISAVVLALAAMGGAAGLVLGAWLRRTARERAGQGP